MVAALDAWGITSLPPFGASFRQRDGDARGILPRLALLPGDTGFAVRQRGQMRDRHRLRASAAKFGAGSKDGTIMLTQ